MEKIGFIGLGNMGLEMAKNLSESNYDVSGFDTEKRILKNIEQFNIHPQHSIEQICVDNTIIITMLPNGSIVNAVWNEILKYTNDNTLLVDCSTIDVSTTKMLHDKASKLNIYCLDAPVSGGTIGAKNATLTFMVGGKKDAYERMLPLFEAMGSKSFLCGSSGSGQGIKLCNNLLLAVTMRGVAESFNLAQKLNLNQNSLFDVLSTSSGSCWAVNNYCPIENIGPNSPADNNFKPGFSVNLMHKDLSLALEASNQSKSNMDFGKLCIQLYENMIENDKGNLDFSAIIKELK